MTAVQESSFDNPMAGNPAQLFAQVGQQTFNLALEGQKAAFSSMLATSNAAITNTRIQLMLANDFVARLAAAHSPSDVADAWQQFGQAQLAAFGSGVQPPGLRREESQEETEVVPTPSSVGAD